MAPTPSITECCFKKTVDRQMETMRIPEPMWAQWYFLRIPLLIMAMWVPMELYTWMLGNTFVQVSVLYTVATRAENKFLSGSMAGRKSVPLRKKGAYDQADRHSGEQENTHPVVILPAGKPGKKRRVPGLRIKNPEQIGYNKIFIKGDQVIQGHMHNVIVSGDCFFPGNRTRAGR